MTFLPGLDASPAQMNPDWLESHQCQQCSKCFSREDHLRRHELTHDFPKFACEFNGCAMRFHRRDVLTRHQTVHTHNSRKQRRKPRRGSLPLNPASVRTHANIPQPWDQNILSPDPTHMEYNVDQSDIPLEWPSDLIDWMSPDFAFEPCEPLRSTAPENLPFEDYDYSQPSIITVPNASSGDSASPLDSDRMASTIAACIASFQQHYLLRLPFIHSSTIREPDLPDAIKYSMAALGSLHVDQYKGIANELHNWTIQEIRSKTTIVRFYLSVHYGYTTD